MPIVPLPGYVPGLGGGDPVEAIIGTGTSGPQGVECVLEFNDLYMNVRDWIDTYVITGIDGLGDADVRDTREVNPQQDGETYFDAFYGGRTIVLSGHIRAHHIFKLRDMQQALRQAFADLTRERALVFHADEPLDSLFIMCKKSQSLVMAEAQQNMMWQRNFQVTLRASNPRFMQLIPEVVSIAPDSGAEVTNHGSYFAQPTITLQGAMESPSVINETTERALVFDGDVLASETITVDFFNKRIVNQTGASVFRRVAAESDWPELAPGLNLISVSSPDFDGGAGVSLSYRHSYI